MDNSGPQKSLIRLAMIGDGGVGKTALVIQLCLNKFVETYDPTIEDSYRKRISLNDQATTLEVMDTAGQEEFDMLRDQWIRDGEGFMLVYSITRKVSFTKVHQYYTEILNIKGGEPFGAVLVGNKIDQDEERQVNTEEGEKLAKKWNIPFFETSAKLNVNTELAFSTLAKITLSSGEDANDSEDVGNDSVEESDNPTSLTASANKTTEDPRATHSDKSHTSHSPESQIPSKASSTEPVRGSGPPKDQTNSPSKPKKKHKKKCVVM